MTTLAGLRERKKAQTRDLLCGAAYAIVRDEGIDALAADAVAERAGVSRRTFFNYFPSLVAVLEPIFAAFFSDIDERLAQSPLDVPVMESIARLVEEADDPVLLERITVLGAIAERSPAHRGLLHEMCQDWLGSFEDRLRVRLGPDADELTVVGATTAVVSAAEASLKTWVRQTGGEVTPDTVALHQRMLADAIRRLGAGFDHS